MQQLGHDSSKCLLLVVSWSFAHHRDHLRHGHHEGLETVKSGFPDCDDHDVGKLRLVVVVAAGAALAIVMLSPL